MAEGQLHVGRCWGGRQEGLAEGHHADDRYGDDVRAFHRLDAFHLLDLLGEAHDPGIRDPLGHRGVSGRGRDGKLGAFLRHGHGDGPQQCVRRSGEAKGRDDALGHKPGLGHRLVLGGFGLGQVLAHERKAEVIRAACHHDPAGLRRVDLRLKEGPAKSEHGEGQGESQDALPPGPGDAQVVLQRKPRGCLPVALGRIKTSHVLVLSPVPGPNDPHENLLYGTVTALVCILTAQE